MTPPWVDTFCSGLRETFYLLEYQFIAKGYNLATAGRQGMGKGSGASTPSPNASSPPSPNLHLFTNLEALWNLPFQIFMEASFHRHDWLNHWPLVTNSTFKPPPPQRLGWGDWDWQFQSLNQVNHLVGSPILRCFPNPLINISRDIFLVLITANSKSFRSFVLETDQI